MQELYSQESTISMEHNQYCAYVHNKKDFVSAFELIRKHNLKYELHANRVRFWVKNTHYINVVCALRFKSVDHETDHMTGR